MFKNKAAWYILAVLVLVMFAALFFPRTAYAGKSSGGEEGPMCLYVTRLGLVWAPCVYPIDPPVKPT